MKSEQEIKVTLPISILSGKKKIRKYHLNLNQYRNWHFQVSNNIKKQFKQEVKGFLDFSFYGKIEIEYTYFAPDARVRDLMNYITVVDKFFQDALVEEGCIDSDDTNTVVKIISIYGGVDRSNPRMEAVIKHYDI